MQNGLIFIRSIRQCTCMYSVVAEINTKIVVVYFAFLTHCPYNRPYSYSQYSQTSIIWTRWDKTNNSPDN